MLVVVLLQQVALDAVDDLIDVGLLVAQVVVVHLLEDRTQDLALGLERPFGVVLLVADGLDRRLGNHLVVEHQQVRVQEARGLRRRVGGNVLADGYQLPARSLDGALETRHFFLDILARDDVFGDFRQFALQHEGLADGDPVTDAGAVQG